MRALVLAVGLLAPALAHAGSIDASAVGVTEKLGAEVPQDVQLVDQAGRVVHLRDYFADGKPVLLVLAYYRCPQLCGLILQGAATALRETGWTPGKQYRVVTVSFDPGDTPLDARQKQAPELAALGIEGRSDAWPFLTGSKASVEALTRAVGFNYVRDPDTGQFAHPAVLTILSPAGKVSRYLYGIAFEPRDVRLALLEAAAGRTGSAFERVILRCYAYDPATRRYGLYVTGLLRGGGVVILASVVGLVGLLWRRERRARKDRPP